MSMDLSRFHDVFFEESFEAVNTIEASLLEVDLDAPDPESINIIFRAAHSIKGGSATFGFSQVAAYTHVMENLLDEVRAGKRRLTQPIVDVLLESVDAMRLLLSSAKASENIPEEEFTQHKSKLEAISQDQASLTTSNAAFTDSGAAPAAESFDADDGVSGWRVVFTPHKEMMQRGNDPLRLAREVAALAEGDAEIECDLSALPDWEHFEPLNSYLGWTVRLRRPVDKAQIDDAFAWVEDECDMAIVPIPKAQSAPSQQAMETLAEPSAPVDEQAQASDKGASPAAKQNKPAMVAESQSIRVDLEKVDALINMVGELVITQSMLNMLSEDEALQGMEKLLQGLTQLKRQTRALQEGVMQIRMLPISFCFNRFPRMVRDLSRQLGKDIELMLSGENTEVDKTVIEKITDPLVHLVRNSVDHGIESPADRTAKGKPEHGSVYLRAYHQVGNIVIEVEDDGKGLDPQVLLSKAKRKGLIAGDAILSEAQIFELIFLPGFSTKEEASDLSGRGVGMDVVKRNVQSLGGSIQVESELNRRTRFTIRLPLTLAIMDGQLISLGEELYVIPLVTIIESLQPDPSMINRVAGTHETIKLRGAYLPVLRLSEALDAAQNESKKSKPLTDGIIVIVEHESRRFGLFVDELLSQQQIVIKSLEENYRMIPGVSAATILGDGRVALILDVSGLSQLQKDSEVSYADAG
ncbi:Chemotaxis protein histidine kinase and related kinase [Hahella chejuensis KCTC 2396]|uniref:Chemotaxis protein CheA n=1 Tax=Hahella chejuensis (strain KCTC 2396) TaxID=349521 RepID=Q2SPQ9_HAHCH|nr:chemotaxis protein CheA [Hahella chejuensis]ABC27365.1 Chemotaxis protein histidine kinase and related kinase [Hahella chejuensis KCTC 2396]